MKKKALIFAGVITLFLFLIVGFYVYYFNIKKVYLDGQFEIKKGQNSSQILRDFHIKNNYLIKIYLRLHKIGGRIKAGTYTFSDYYTLSNFFNLLERGSYEKIKITIPEGYTLKQIERILISRELIDKEKFRLVLKNKTDFYYNSPYQNFEGYFFPDTYYFIKGIKEEEIVEKFLKRFLEKFPPSKYEDKKAFYKSLVLASIIEKEAYRDDEKRIISSVFHNRIKKRMKLESCATVEYLFDYQKKKLYYKDLKIDSEYNTYKNYGLPPAPISNPGEASILAAMNPKETKYLYFVAKEDRSHYFSKTYKEHLRFQNKNKKE